jgi:acyl-coenzyme A thioesterase PaaI-like protein
MAILELPHTRGCLVCGQSNPHGLKLHLFVVEATGAVRVDFTPKPQHIGFEGIVHGGILATVIDEAMVWAATWAGKRFCVCAEMTVRFQQIAPVGEPLSIEANVKTLRSRLIETTCLVRNAGNDVSTEASGKYTPVPESRSREFMSTFVEEPATVAARQLLQART